MMSRSCCAAGQSVSASHSMMQPRLLLPPTPALSVSWTDLWGCVKLQVFIFSLCSQLYVLIHSDLMYGFYINKFPSGCVGKSKSSQKELSLRSFRDCPEFNANKVFIGGLYHVTFCLLLVALPNILWPSFRCGFRCARGVVT